MCSAVHCFLFFSFKPSSCPALESVHACSVTSDSLRLYGLSPPGSSVRGILQARILEWVDMPSFRGSSPPRDQTLCLLHWQTGSLPLVLPGKLLRVSSSIENLIFSLQYKVAYFSTATDSLQIPKYDPFSTAWWTVCYICHHKAVQLCLICHLLGCLHQSRMLCVIEVSDSTVGMGLFPGYSPESPTLWKPFISGKPGRLATPD